MLRKSLSSQSPNAVPVATGDQNPFYQRNQPSGIVLFSFSLAYLISPGIRRQRESPICCLFLEAFERAHQMSEFIIPAHIPASSPSHVGTNDYNQIPFSELERDRKGFSHGPRQSRLLFGRFSDFRKPFDHESDHNQVHHVFATAR